MDFPDVVGLSCQAISQKRHYAQNVKDYQWMLAQVYGEEVLPEGTPPSTVRQYAKRFIQDAFEAFAPLFPAAEPAEAAAAPTE